MPGLIGRRTIFVVAVAATQLAHLLDENLDPLLDDNDTTQWPAWAANLYLDYEEGQ